MTSALRTGSSMALTRLVQHQEKPPKASSDRAKEKEAARQLRLPQRSERTSYCKSDSAVMSSPFPSIPTTHVTALPHQKLRTGRSYMPLGLPSPSQCPRSHISKHHVRSAKISTIARSTTCTPVLEAHYRRPVVQPAASKLARAAQRPGFALEKNTKRERDEPQLHPWRALGGERTGSAKIFSS